MIFSYLNIKRIKKKVFRRSQKAKYFGYSYSNKIFENLTIILKMLTKQTYIILKANYFKEKANKTNATLVIVMKHNVNKELIKE